MLIFFEKVAQTSLEHSDKKSQKIHIELNFLFKIFKTADIAICENH